MPHAAVVYKFDEPMKVEEVTYRDLREGEVMIKMAACGVCHSDLSVLNLIIPCPTPVILGHEAAGVVEEVGPGVTDVAKGDHVIGIWKPSCGNCRLCRSGKGHLCDLGTNPTMLAMDRCKVGDTPVIEFLAVGGFSEYTILNTTSLVKIEDSMPLDKAALLGCAVITGFGAAVNQAQVKKGDSVAIFGCGGVGLNIIQGAVHNGAETIVGVDLDDKKLEFAKTFGATHTLNGGSDTLIQDLKKLTVEKMGVDHSFDAVGHLGVIEQAAAVTCKGGNVIMVGVPKMTDKFDLHPFGQIFTEKPFRGTVAGSCTCSEALPELIDLYKNGKLKLDELVTKTYPLNEINDAFDDLRNGKNARGVIVF